MRRPVFARWSRTECQRIAHASKFSMPQLAALAQTPHRGNADAVPRKKLAAALHLYCMASGCEEGLLSHVWDDGLRQRLARASKAIGARDIQRLALRETPLLTLPGEYRDVMQDFRRAYYAPEIAAERKRALGEESRLLQAKAGISCADISRATGVAATNVSAYLSSGKVDKVRLDKAEEINAFLKARAREFEERQELGS